MRINKIISLIFGFRFLENLLFIEEREQFRILNSDFDEIYKLTELSGFQVISNANDYLVFTDFNEIKIFKGNKIIFTIKNFSYISSNSCMFILRSNQTTEVVFFNINTGFFLKTSINIWGVSFTNNSFFFTIPSLSNKLDCYFLETGDLLWEFQLSEASYPQGEYGLAYEKNIVSVLGEYEGIVWVVTYLGHLIGLSTATGEVKHHLTVPNNIPTSWGDWQVYVRARKSAIDHERGLIFGIDNTDYWECDLSNPEESYTYYDIEATCKEHNIVAKLAGYHPIWDKDELFFGQQEFGKNPSFVGIFNRSTKQITWTSHEVGEVGTFQGLSKIDYTSGRLYVLDATSTLHIFERESELI